MNKSGYGRYISRYTIVHANEGTFTRPSKKTDRLRLKSGGHGQKNLDLLDKYGIEYHIVKIYTNGVRVGYVINHKDKLKSKKDNPGQTWFPSNWSEKTIIKAGQYIVSLKKNKKLRNSFAYGFYKKVKVGIYIDFFGNITTIFPDVNQKKSLWRRK